jgi:hypothetical protein
MGKKKETVRMRKQVDSFKAIHSKDVEYNNETMGIRVVGQLIWQ